MHHNNGIVYRMVGLESQTAVQKKIALTRANNMVCSCHPQAIYTIERKALPFSGARLEQKASFKNIVERTKAMMDPIRR